MGKNLNIRTIIATGIIFAFLVNTLGPSAQADEFRLPAPGVMVGLSPVYSPAVLKGLKLDPKNPFRFHFFVDKGEEYTSHPARSEGSQQEQLRQESSKLIKYFLASLTIPEKDLWVNLSPYEKDRIVPQEFGKTEMGRDLLAEDYLLKQITSSLIYPESQLGKEFWQKVYAQAQARYGTTNIPINTFNKVWIVPDKAVVYENNGTAFVLENHLKVMLEQDYLSLSHNGPPKTDHDSNGINAIGSQIVREIIIPALTREVNEGKNFAQLRQVFYSLILATWYKKKIKDSILNKVYSNQSKIRGVGFSRTGNDVEYIYQRYLQAFKKGVYNYIKEEPDPVTNQTIPRKYFSGGVNARTIARNMAMIGLKQVNSVQIADLAQRSLVDVTVDAALISPKVRPAADAAMVPVLAREGDGTGQVYMQRLSALANNGAYLKQLFDGITDEGRGINVLEHLMNHRPDLAPAIEHFIRDIDHVSSGFDSLLGQVPENNIIEHLNRVADEMRRMYEIADGQLLPLLDDYKDSMYPEGGQPASDELKENVVMKVKAGIESARHFIDTVKVLSNPAGHLRSGLTGKEWYLEGMVNEKYFIDLGPSEIPARTREAFYERINNINSSTPNSDIEMLIDDIFEKADAFMFLQFGEGYSNEDYLDARNFVMTIEYLFNVWQKKKLQSKHKDLLYWIVQKSLITRWTGVLLGRSVLSIELAQQGDIPDAWKASEYVVEAISEHMKDVGHAIEINSLTEEESFIDLDVLLPHLLLLVERYAKGQYEGPEQENQLVSIIAKGLDPNIYSNNDDKWLKIYRELLIKKLLELGTRLNANDKIRNLFTRILSSVRQNAPTNPLFDYLRITTEGQRDFFIKILEEERASFNPAMSTPAHQKSSDGVGVSSKLDLKTFSAAGWKGLDKDIKYIDSRLDTVSNQNTTELLNRLEGIFVSISREGRNPQQWQFIGRYLREKLKEKGLAHPNQYLARVNRKFIAASLFKDKISQQGHMLEVFSDENVLEQFLAVWQGVYTAEHLKLFGPHAERINNHVEFLDNDLIVGQARRMLTLLLCYRNDPALKEIPQAQAGFEGKVKFTYRDLMLWGLAVMINPLIHEYMLNPYIPLPAQATRQAGYDRWPQGGEEAMNYYIGQIVNDISWEKDGVRHTAAASEVDELLAEAIGNNYEAKGLRLPMEALSYEDSFGPDLWDNIIPGHKSPFLEDQTLILAAPLSAFNGQKSDEFTFFPSVDPNEPYKLGLSAYMFLTRLPVMGQFLNTQRQLIEMDNKTDNEAGRAMEKVSEESKSKLVQFEATIDPAMTKGGIDLNPAQLSMQIKNGGKDFKFDFNGTTIDAAQVTGATFTIRKMTPVLNLPFILGLTPKPAEKSI